MPAGKFTNPFKSYKENQESSKFGDENGAELIGMEPPKNDVARISPWLANKNFAPVRIKKNERGTYVAYAGKMFLTGDIVEVSPCKILRSIDIYSEPVADLCFNVGNDEFALPFGYAVFYQNSINAKKDGNVDYQWNESEKSLFFRAIRKIDEGEELVIKVNAMEY